MMAKKKIASIPRLNTFCMKECFGLIDRFLITKVEKNNRIVYLKS